MAGSARTRARRVEALPEHPCGSRFPDIIGESEAMLRLKASILKAAAHGRKKGGGERDERVAVKARQRWQEGLCP